MSERTKTTTQLTGRGGVGLVMFHLARLGVDFAETIQDSNRGDLWVKLPNGKIVIAEVKSAYASQWPIKRAQLKVAEIFFFVRMDTGRVFICRRETLAATKQQCDPISITQNFLAEVSEFDWLAFGITEPALNVPVPFPILRKRSARKREKTVRRTLADGTVKFYTYPADEEFWKRNGKTQENGKTPQSTI